MSEKNDFAETLLQAADIVDELSRSDLQVLLRKAALMIKDLRELVGIREEIELEHSDPAGHA